jgi:hypothetical protein
MPLDTLSAWPVAAAEDRLIEAFDDLDATELLICYEGLTRTLGGAGKRLAEKMRTLRGFRI